MNLSRPSSPRIHDSALRPLLRWPTAAQDLRRLMHQALRRLPHDSTMLAIGCEQAFLAAQLTEYAADVTVLDTSPAQIRQLAPRFPEVVFRQHQPSQPLPFADHTFDAVWCGELLDRVFDPSATLREIKRVLIPGGDAHIAVPYHGSVGNVVFSLFHRDGTGGAHPPMRHFTRSTLKRMAREAGFTIAGVVTTGPVRRLAGGLVPRMLLLSVRKPVLTTGAARRAPRGRRPAVAAARGGK